MIFEQLLELEQILNALFRRRATPCGKSGGGGGDGGVDIRFAAERHLRQRFTRRRIDDGSVFGGGGALPLAVDVIWQLTIRRHNFDFLRK